MPDLQDTVPVDDFRPRAATSAQSVNAAPQPHTVPPQPQPLFQHQGQSRAVSFEAILAHVVSESKLSDAGKKFLNDLSDQVKSYRKDSNVELIDIKSSNGYYALRIDNRYFVLIMSEIPLISGATSLDSRTDTNVLVSVINTIEQMPSLAGCVLVNWLVVTPLDYPRVDRWSNYIANNITYLNDEIFASLNMETIATLSKSIRVEHNPSAYDDFVEAKDPHAVHARADIKLVITYQDESIKINKNDPDGRDPNVVDSIRRRTLLTVGAYVDFFKTNARINQVPAGAPVDPTTERPIPPTFITAPVVIITDIQSVVPSDLAMHLAIKYMADYISSNPDNWKYPFTEDAGDDVGGLYYANYPSTIQSDGRIWTSKNLSDINLCLQNYTICNHQKYDVNGNVLPFIPDLAIHISRGRATIPGLQDLLGSNADTRVANSLQQLFLGRVETNGSYTYMEAIANSNSQFTTGVVREDNGRCVDSRVYGLLKAINMNVNNVRTILASYCEYSSRWDSSIIDYIYNNINVNVQPLFTTSIVAPSGTYLTTLKKGVECFLGAGSLIGAYTDQTPMTVNYIGNMSGYHTAAPVQPAQINSSFQGQTGRIWAPE